MTEITHQIHSIKSTVAIMGGTRIIVKLSLTNNVAVLMTAIASRILLNQQMKTKIQKQNHARTKYEEYSKAF